jgi:hypothetical protein
VYPKLAAIGNYNIHFIPLNLPVRLEIGERKARSRSLLQTNRVQVSNVIENRRSARDRSSSASD